TPVWPLTLSTAPPPPPDPVVGSGLSALTARKTPSSSLNMMVVAMSLAHNRRDENLGGRAVDGRRGGVIVIDANPLALFASVHEHAWLSVSQPHDPPVAQEPRTSRYGAGAMDWIRYQATSACRRARSARRSRRDGPWSRSRRSRTRPR